MKRRIPALQARLLSCVVLLALTGCSSENGVWSQYFQLLRQSIRGGVSNPGVTRDQAAAIPYASLGYRVDGGREAILVLATNSNSDLLWTAASHVVLLMRDGRIARSVGLPHDLAGMAMQGAGTLPPLSDALKAPYRSSRTVDLSDIGAYAVPLTCVTAARGAQTITILGAALATIRVDETCQSTNPRWSFTDNYWLDAKTGFIWHSIQHTDDALRNLLVAAKELNPAGRIITLFGCGGDRDRTKRPLMGEAAGRASDIVVLTSDNPRSEDPLLIINDAIVGVQRTGTKFLVEADRERAIEKALDQARPGDIVLLAGKGHETSQVLRDRTIEFDDREIARRILRQRGFGD